MKSFILHILKVAALFVVLLIVLDVSYTAVFLHTKEKTKLNWVMNMHDRQVDYIILGSSRVLFHLDTDLINDSTGLEGYNLGEPDFGLNESLLMLKLFYEQGNRAKNVFIQLDNNWNKMDPNDLGSATFMPFIYKKTVRHHYAQSGLKFKLYAYIPFIRYMYYSHVIGFRGVLNALLNDRPRGSLYGYDHLEGKIKPETIVKETFQAQPNNILTNEITQLGHNNHSHVVYFTAPILRYKQQDFELFNAKVINYTNFANTISDLNFFYDNIHLNGQGARLFTQNFMHCYFKHAPKLRTPKGLTKLESLPLGKTNINPISKQ